LSSSPRPELGEGLGERANTGLEVGGLAIAPTVSKRSSNRGLNRSRRVRYLVSI
jgi:hypothetical protein